MRFYVDTCIYLNLWQKEVGRNRELPFWKSAKDFFEKCEAENHKIFYSGFVLKELKHILDEDEFNLKSELLKSKFSKVEASESDYNEARKLESELNYEIGFFDCFHVVLTKKIGAILVTRDILLIKKAREYIQAATPESFL